MKLIAGLGNPGAKYADTKHNVGFLVTDRLADKYNARLKRRLFKSVKETPISVFKEEVVVIQPLTYMNLSGGCILNFFKKSGLPLKDLLVVCDDINLPLGKIRIRASGSSGGHNGLISVISSLASEDFPRLRIGIGNDRAEETLSDYVLSKFSSEEEKIMEDVVDNAVAACESWIKDGIEITMNKFN